MAISTPAVAAIEAQRYQRHQRHSRADLYSKHQDVCSWHKAEVTDGAAKVRF